jgi:hypothetical protein
MQTEGQAHFDTSGSVNVSLKDRRFLCRPGDIDPAAASRPTRAYDGLWWEWQANRAIGGFLLPKNLVLIALVPLRKQSLGDREPVFASRCPRSRVSQFGRALRGQPGRRPDSHFRDVPRRDRASNGVLARIVHIANSWCQAICRLLSKAAPFSIAMYAYIAYTASISQGNLADAAATPSCWMKAVQQHRHEHRLQERQADN